MTKRARALAKYLSDKCAWSLDDQWETSVCSKCSTFNSQDGAKFCHACGAKLPKPTKRRPTTVEQLEEALSVVIDGKQLRGER